MIFNRTYKISEEIRVELSGHSQLESYSSRKGINLINIKTKQYLFQLIQIHLVASMKRALVAMAGQVESALEGRPYAGFLLQFIFSSGILATLYSRCSLTMVQTVRFFCIISSSRSRRPASQASYQASSQSHINGLSEMKMFRGKFLYSHN